MDQLELASASQIHLHLKYVYLKYCGAYILYIMIVNIYIHASDPKNFRTPQLVEKPTSWGIKGY